MQKKILVLSGSPRAKGNSDLLTEAFVKGAKKAGHNVSVFDAGKKKIDGCKACNTCFSTGKACSFNDDFNELANMLEDTELLVLVTPLYWFSFSAQIKSAIDKIYSFGVAGKAVKIKEIAMIACAETSDMEDFQGLVESYNLISSYTKFEDKGVLLVPSVNQKGDVLKTDYIEKAENMGLNI